jgi:putative oxidoreductase
MPVDYGLVVLRVAVGLIFLAHGIKHARGQQKTTTWFAGIGFRQPALQWFAVTATEIGVGVLLVAGAATSLAAAGAIAMMVVAFMSVHRYAGFWITARPDEGWEYVFTLAAAALTLAIAGPGSVSVDDQIDVATKLDGWVGLGIAALGVLAALGQLAIFYRPGDVRMSGSDSPERTRD